MRRHPGAVLERVAESEDACRHIAFIDRVFMNRRSLSIQCFDVEGAGIFKAFVRRDTRCELLADRVTAFNALREHICQLES